MTKRSLFLLTAIATTIFTGCGSDALEPEEALDEESSAVVGGSSANIADFPWQVRLQSTWGLFCGGVVLNGNWILTAQHCIDQADTFAITPPSILDVGAGSSTQSGIPTTGQVRYVSDIVPYPGFNAPWDGEDLALVRLSASLDLSTANVKAIPLTTSADSALMDPGDTATVTGWGAAVGGGNPIDSLQKADLTFVSNTDASNAYAYPIGSDQIGTSGASGRDACNGDSGGPLVVTKGSGKALAGLVSWNDTCASPTYPTMYAKIPFFESWINSTSAKSFTQIQSHTNLAAAQNNWQYFSFSVPSGMQVLNVHMWNGSGNADLYVRYNAQPTTSTYACRPWLVGNIESCSIPSPTAGTWYIGIRGYTSYSGVSLKATRL